MIEKLDVWIYRPDKASEYRRINRDFLYNGKGETCSEIEERRENIKQQIKEHQEKISKKVLTLKMEVPNE